MTTINKFDLNSLTPTSSILIIGKRGTGKSRLVKLILEHFSDIEKGHIFHHDMDNGGTYSDEAIENIIMEQSKVVNMDDSNIYVVIDDCKFNLNNVHVQSLFLDSRHYKILNIVVVQQSFDIPFSLNFDFVFLFDECDSSKKELTYRHHADKYYPSFGTFGGTFSELTDNYGCMVISNRGTKGISWFRANPPE